MLHIALLFGGTSSERDISIKTGEAVWAALERIGHKVTPIDVGHDSIDVLENSRCDFAFIALHGGEGENGTIQRRLGDAPTSSASGASSAGTLSTAHTSR